jgi:hypothetical protein
MAGRGFLLRTVAPALVCLAVIGCFYGFLAARGFAGVPGGLEALVTPASALLTAVVFLDLRERGVETRFSIALLTFVLPPAGVALWLRQWRRHPRRPSGAPAPASAPEPRPVPTRRRTSGRRARRPRRRG